MKKYFWTTALLRTITLIAASVFHPAIAGPLAPTDDARISSTPQQASYAHHLRFRVFEVVSIERVESTHILKLRVERAYGKIDVKSLDRAKAHETQRFTILFPASRVDAVKPGDLIDYELVGFASPSNE